MPVIMKKLGVEIFDVDAVYCVIGPVPMKEVPSYADLLSERVDQSEPRRYPFDAPLGDE